LEVYLKILVTGGGGYIGSTICNALKDAGHIPIILDSLVTGKREFCKDHIFYHADIADIKTLNSIFLDHSDIYAAIHCAALVFVPDSVQTPYKYYKENVSKSMIFMNHLRRYGCSRLVFSSSASVYDTTQGNKVTEESHINPMSPYARSKYMVEMILQDYSNAYNLKGISLRYFNPLGADPKMRSGLQYNMSSRVLDRLIMAANNDISAFNITGVNWPTRDGTGLRDYIHVWDLAMAHVKAVERFDQVVNNKQEANDYFEIINLGLGDGITVRELLSSFEHVIGRKIKTTETDPRPGDVAGVFANNDKARKMLCWQPQKSIINAIEDEIRWRDAREIILGY
jgi:UDP-glucose 4-epimerase